MSAETDYDVVIIGGGIVGLATALRIKERQPDLRIVVLEKEATLAAHQTGHNSGVIHSGVYYTPGSLKARNCIAGYRRLLEFCERYGVAYKLCGKVIVATDASELPALDRIYERGLANGLGRIERIGPERLREIEPHATGIAAVSVPYAGIVDFRAVCAQYARVFRELGGEIRFATRVNGLTRVTSGGARLRLAAGPSPNSGAPSESRADATELFAKLTINCAGLHSDTVASFSQDQPLDFRIIPFRGEYYELRPERRFLVRSLIYPVPDPAFPFLGVHFTSLIGGGVEAGPNAVLAFKKEGYRWSDVSVRDIARTLAWPGFRRVARRYWRTGLSEMYRSFSKAAFTRALQKLVPEIRAADLLPGGSGVRAQACARQDGLLDDFLFLENDAVINVGNAPSPAATSSLAIGETVADLALKRF